MLSQAFEEGDNRLDMRYRIGGEHNDIVEVSCNLVEVLNRLIDHLDEPSSRIAAGLGHDELLVEADGCSERCKVCRILMRLQLMERGNQVKQGKPPFSAQGLYDFVHAGNCQLTELADLVELLEVHRDPHAAGRLRDDHQRARIWRSRVLDQSSCEVLVERRVHFLDQNRVDALGSESDRSAALLDRDLEGHQGARSKVRLRGGKHIGKFTEHITELLDGRGGPSRVI